MFRWPNSFVKCATLVSLVAAVTLVMSPESLASKSETGERIYNRTCGGCHQRDGAGKQDFYPPIVHSEFLASKEKVIAQVIMGGSGEIVVNGVKYNDVMPPQELNDEEIASVVSYIYERFEGKHTVVAPEDVKKIRAGK